MERIEVPNPKFDDENTSLGQLAIQSRRKMVNKLRLRGDTNEIIAIKSRIEGANLTVIPLSLYTTKHFIKAELALGKGKKKYEKKEAIKKKDIERELEQELGIRS